MDKKALLHSGIAQFTLGCTLVSFYYLSVLQSAQYGRFLPGLVLFFGPVCCLLLHLFLRKPRSMLALAGFNAGGIGIFCGLYLWLDGWQDVSQFIFAAAFFLFLALRGTGYALKPPALKDMLILLDVSFAALALLAFSLPLMGHSLLYAAPALCGVLFALMNVLAARASLVPGGRSLLLFGAALAAIALCMLLLAGAAAPAGRGIVTVWNAVGSCIGGLFSALYRLLLWLTPPAPEYTDEGELPAGSQPVEDTAPPAEPNPVVTAILMAILAAAAVAGLIWLLRKLSQCRLGGRKRSLQSTVSPVQHTRQPNPLPRLLAAWKTALRTGRWLYRNRSTPAGVYFILERRCRRSPWRKRPGETPRMFLTRLSAAALQDEALQADFRLLIPAVDAALYSDAAPTLPAASARRLRRSVLKTVRRHALQTLLQRITHKQKS